MRTMSISYPDEMLFALNQSPQAFEEEARIVLAVKLYELGRLTSGQAAELAAIPRVQFLLNCHHYGSASVTWDTDEISAEFRGNDL